MKRTRGLLAVLSGSVIIGLCLLGRGDVRVSASEVAVSAVTGSIAEAIDGEGRVRAGIGGSFDMKGYRMEMTTTGEPRFVANSPCNGWETRFGTGIGAAGAVLAMAVVGSNIYVGGSFTIIGGTPANYIAKYDTVNNVWSGLGSGGGNGASSAVTSMVVIGTDLYVGGSFTQVNTGSAQALFANYVARYDTETAEWSALATDNGGDGIGKVVITESSMVNTLAVIGTDLYVGGDFNVANRFGTEVTTSNLAKYDTLRRTWSAPGKDGGAGVNGVVRTLAVIGSDLYAGGDFTSANQGGPAVTTNRVARYNPATSTWSGLGSGGGNGVDARVNALVASGTDLYVGGEFGVTNVGGATVSANGVARFATAAQTWGALGSGGGNGVDLAVSTMIVAGNDLYLGGAFTSANDGASSPVAAYRVVRYSLSDQTWNPLGGATENGLNNEVVAMAMLGGSLYVGGYFTQANYGGVSTIDVNRIARYTLSSQLWSAVGSGDGLGSGVAPQVSALAVIGTDLYVGGSFTSVNTGSGTPLTVGYVAKFNTLTGVWSHLGEDGGNGVNNPVNALAVSGTTLYIGGLFTEANAGIATSVPANHIVAYDTVAQTWHILGVTGGNGVDDVVNALAVSSTSLYVGGNFQTANSGATSQIGASYIAQYNLSTGVWSAMGTDGGTGFDSGVYALAIGGSDLYAGGFFSAVNQGATSPIPVSYIARYNPTTMAWTAMGTEGGNGVNGSVFALAASGTTLYVGGIFNAVNEGGATVVAASGIASYNMSTQVWSALGSGGGNGVDNGVNALTVVGTDLYVAGFQGLANVGAANPVEVSGIARYRIGTQSWGALGSGVDNGVNGFVNAVAVIGSGLYVGGFFNAVGGITTADNLARYNLNAPLTVGSIARIQQPLTSSGSVQYRVTFSESVSGVQASNFSPVASGVSGATVTSVTGSGTTWTVTVNTGTGTGTLGLNLTDATGITNGLGATVCAPQTGEVYRLDRTAPLTVFTSTPPAATTSTTAGFVYTTQDVGGARVVRVECRLDSAAFANCSGSSNFSGLSEGSHTFEVRAEDTLGNVNAPVVSYTWTIDNTAPETTISSKPSNPSAGSSASFSFAGTDTGGSGVSSYQCRLDSASFADCASPTILTGLTLGSHTFEVRAVDAAGNIDPTPASWTWVISCQAIAITPTVIENGALTRAYSQAIVVTPEGGSYSYTLIAGSLPTGLVLDGATGLITGTPLATGTFNFTIRASGGGCTGDRAYTMEILAQATYEADVSPRGSINGDITVSDWVQVGRFAVQLDTPSDITELQRSDSAPRNTFGNGVISVADWVQAGRYAVTLDPKTVVGGPTSPSPIVPGSDSLNDMGRATIRAVEVPGEDGTTRLVTIELDAASAVNGAGFTLRFDPLEADLVEADSHPGQLAINRRREREGLLALALVLAPGESFRSGTSRLLTLRFKAHSRKSTLPLRVHFEDGIIAREVVSPDARPLLNVRFETSVPDLRP